MLARARETTGNDPADRLPWISAGTSGRTEARGDWISHVFHGGLTSIPLSIQRLLADLAARFVTIEPQAIDDAVVDGLRQIAEALRLDRAIMWTTDEASSLASHYWFKNPQSSCPEPFDLGAVPFISSRLQAGEATSFTRIDEVPDPIDRETLRRQALQSAALVPVVSTASSGKPWGVLAFSSTTAGYEWTPATIELFRLVSAVLGLVLARKAALTALQRALDELHRLREHLTEEAVPRASRLDDRLDAANLHVRREVHDGLGTGIIVGHSAAIRRVLDQVKKVAATDSTVLLLGETGTGKELIAALIHELSARRGRAMVRVNCAAIPATLIESELFGREKGAFTGALARQIGRFELADRSTIFLDEIGDLPEDVQVKLLRVLEERQVERLGSPKAVHVDVRIVAATHRDLEKRMVDAKFREDLFYRLNVFPIQVPPLRERAEDIPLLVWRFVDEFSRSFGKRIDSISRENMAALQRYSWPGNIRELRNVVERAMIVATGTQLTIVLPTTPSAALKRSVRLADVEKEHIRVVLESAGWRIRGAGGAAEQLGLRPTTLETRMEKLGLKRPRPGEASASA